MRVGSGPVDTKCFIASPVMAKFFYTPKPRQFDYKPRYYDPEKEAREQRRRELLGERDITTDDDYVPGDLLRHRKMQRMIAADNSSAKRKKSSSFILLIAVLVLLVLAVAWVFN